MSILDNFVGKHISDICDRYTSNAINHCAHFVSHAIGLQSGITCKSIVTGGKTPGAMIRVQDVFALCGTVNEWDGGKPGNLTSCLIFVTAKYNKVNLESKVFGNIPKKHVGIYSNGYVYHYSNSKHKVVKQTPAEFISWMGSAYGAGMLKYYGSIPSIAMRSSL